MGSLTGTVALVTGASRGIGKGVALGLAESGATVYITGRTKISHGNGCSLQLTATEAEKLGGRCVPIECDHQSDSESEAAVALVVATEGRIDLLVNSAWGGYENIVEDGAFTFAAPFWEQPLWRWDAMFTVGLKATFVCSRRAAAQMVAQQSGLIVNVSSFAGKTYELNALYGTVKSATDRLTSDMGVELAPHGVVAVSIYPGLVRTENVVDSGFFDLSNSESPQFIGRAIAHLFQDSDIQEKNGKVVVAADLAIEYGFTDVDGKQPSSLAVQP
ncbi:MAG: SDR family NAD(P)-dependent oxidoreductase [Gammaproteobacteria bacterium]|nr:SDR family NAD(P)-dependent oxidoreductase [Gammaproteobacteria bacterium]